MAKLAPLLVIAVICLCYGICRQSTTQADKHGLLLHMQTIVPFLQGLVGPKPRLQIRTFENWGLTIDVPYVFYVAPTSLNQLQRLVKVTSSLGFRIRTLGGGHSWSPLFTDEGQILVDVKQIRRQEGPLMEIGQDINSGELTMTVMSGVMIDDMNTFMIQNNVELRSLPNVQSFTIGGAVATASHGGLYDEPEISASLVAVRMVDGRGDLRHFNKEDHPEVIRALRSALGLCGIVYDLTLKVYPLTVVEVTREESLVKDIMDPVRLKQEVESNSFTLLRYFPFTSLTDEEMEEFAEIGHAPASWNPMDDVMFVLHMNPAPSSVLPEPPYYQPSTPPDGLPSKLDLIRAPKFMLDGVRELPNVSYHYLPDATYTDKVAGRGLNAEFRIYDTQDFIASSDAFKTSLTALSKEARSRANLPVTVLQMRWMKNSDCLLCPASVHNDINPNSSGHTVGVEHLGGGRLTTEYKEMLSEVAVEHYPKNSRVHFGKLHQFLPGIQDHLRRVYGRSLKRFRGVCDHLDPKQTFTNDWLRSLVYSVT